SPYRCFSTRIVPLAMASCTSDGGRTSPRSICGNKRPMSPRMVRLRKSVIVWLQQLAELAGNGNLKIDRRGGRRIVCSLLLVSAGGPSGHFPEAASARRALGCCHCLPQPSQDCYFLARAIGFQSCLGKRQDWNPESVDRRQEDCFRLVG